MYECVWIYIYNVHHIVHCPCPFIMSSRVRNRVRLQFGHFSTYMLQLPLCCRRWITESGPPVNARLATSYINAWRVFHVSNHFSFYNKISDLQRHSLTYSLFAMQKQKVIHDFGWNNRSIVILILRLEWNKMNI